MIRYEREVERREAAGESQDCTLRQDCTPLTVEEQKMVDDEMARQQEEVESVSNARFRDRIRLF